ncbi:MAG: hypothetical protein K0S39_2131 [Paenibacillus sp.]|jgi:two-component system sensor histidine kinase YesM|nr:hypothetical protein [Paenibacillus sp.]
MGLLRRLSTAFRNYSLERKVFMTTSVVILLAVPLTGAFSYHEASRILQGYAYNAADQTVNQLSGYMNNELKNVSDRMYLINSSEAMKMVMNWNRVNSDEPYTRVFNTMFSLFSQMRVNSTSIKAIYLYTPRGEFYDGPFEKKNIHFRNTPYYAAITGSQTNIWMHVKNDPLFAGQGDVISLLTRPATELSYLEQNSYVVMTLSTEKFIANLKSIQLVPQGFSMILDELGQPLLLSEESAAAGELINKSLLTNLSEKPSHFEIQINQETFLVNHTTIPFSNWQAVTVQPKERLLQDVRSIQYVTIVMTFILLIISFLLNKWIAKWVTHPLRKLMALMSLVKQGDLNVRFSSDYKDEISELGNRFDDMIMEIQRLLKQMVEEGQAKRKAEMRALQAQINPHFLYNTLDELYWKSLEFEDSSAPEIILSLSRFFRLSLNKGREETTIASELEHVEHYLKLVNHQYKRQFSFDIQIDESAQQITVPKIILQPLVENSVLHAFKANEYKDFHIHVSSKRLDQTIILLVKDNGCGIEPERIDDLNQPVQPASQSVPGGGYAIANIKERLWYFFGERARLTVHSQLGAGTDMEIQIHVIEGEA